MILGNKQFSLVSSEDGLNLNEKNLLSLLIVVIIVGFCVVLAMFGSNVLNVGIRYSEHFMNSVQCTKEMDEDKFFCSKNDRKTLFNNLVSLDKKIDILKKQCKKK